MYSLDFKKLAIRLYKQYQNYRVVTRILNISTSTLHRWVHQGIKARLKPKQPSTMFLLLQHHIKNFLLNNPFSTILSMAQHIHQCLGIKVSTKTVGKYLRHLAFSKKKAFHQTARTTAPEALQRFKECRSQWIQQDKVFFSVDECYFSERILPSYGYSPVGTRLHSTLKPRKWDKRSLIMAVGSDGSVHYRIIQGSVNQNNFRDFIRDIGHSKEGVFLLDNVSFHHSVAKDLSKEAHFLFIPPYSPQYNPVEYCFSKIKGCFRTLMGRIDMVECRPLESKR